MVDIDLNNSKEKKLVKGIFENAMDILAQEDRNLAQINGVLPMLMRGIGIHHSGLLPIVKEVIEILFQEGLLKVRPYHSVQQDYDECHLWVDLQTFPWNNWWPVYCLEQRSTKS